jgi:hypothetical protein
MCTEEFKIFGFEISLDFKIFIFLTTWSQSHVINPQIRQVYCLCDSVEVRGMKILKGICLLLKGIKQNMLHFYTIKTISNKHGNPQL